MVGKISLIPYDPNLSILFLEEKNILEKVFGEELISIHHIGNTTVPGIGAKPIIDILIEVRDIQRTDQLNPAMMAPSYQPKGE